MSALLAEIGPAWAWAIVGLVFGAGELVAPGVFLIWIGLACIGTGVVVALGAPTWPIQALVFAALAAASVFMGRRLTRNPPSLLNQRGHSLVGREFVLDAPILGGVGRLNQGDTSWRLTGPDLPAGTRIRVAGLDGVTLVVEQISA